MVNGFDIHTMGTAINTLTRNTKAPMAAINIWKGRGINVQNMPSASPPAAERRFKCHKDGSCKRGPKKFSHLFPKMTSGCGMYFLNNFFAMLFVLSALFDYSASQRS